MEELAIQVEHVSKHFDDFLAVDDISFEVNKANCFGLLGPNGAGKSTMMNMIYGKTRRDDTSRGEIRVFGHDPANRALEIRFLSGIVPQENNLDVELSVLQNLLIYAKFYGIGKKEALARIEYLLDFMELSEKKEARIKALSGGMQRRLVIARSLLNSPKLLILDEPTTGLDPQVRQLIWDKMRMLKQEGVTILLCTHYMDEAFQICDDLIIMHKGEKVMEGNPADLIKTNMEKWVVEILKPEKLDNMSLPDRIRLERTHSRAMLYSHDLQSLNLITAGFRSGDFLLRQSNLEDLFLRTTGRRLNE